MSDITATFINAFLIFMAAMTTIFINYKMKQMDIFIKMKVDAYMELFSSAREYGAAAIGRRVSDERYNDGKNQNETDNISEKFMKFQLALIRACLVGSDELNEFLDGRIDSLHNLAFTINGSANIGDWSIMLTNMKSIMRKDIDETRAFKKLYLFGRG